jgi:hypothetical protein
VLDEAVRKLWPKAEGQPISGYLTIDILGNNKRQARQATVSVRSTSVTLKPPWRPKGRKFGNCRLSPSTPSWCARPPPADIDEPIEWLLPALDTRFGAISRVGTTFHSASDVEASRRLVVWRSVTGSFPFFLAHASDCGQKL